MATDSTHLLPSDSGVESDTDMSAGGLDLGSVQLAAATPDATIPVNIPRGQQVVVIPVRPGQTIELPTDSVNGLLAKLGADGNLAIVVDGRTIILQGYAEANAESPIRIVTNDGDVVDVADVIAGTSPDLDIQTAAGPAAAGAQAGTTAGSGIFIPFAAGPLLGGFDAEGTLKATQLAYKNIDDERILFTTLEEGEEPAPTPEISISAEGGIDPICIHEDSQGEAILVNASTNAGSHLTTIVISGFPVGGAGFLFNLTGLDLANTTITDNIAVDGTVIITFIGAPVTTFSGSFVVTPPADSDVDLGTLTAKVEAVNDVDPTVKADSTDDAKVIVDAVADGDDVGDDGDADKLSVTLSISDGIDANTTFQNGESGQLAVTATFDDFKDGSETHTITVTAAPGFLFFSANFTPGLESALQIVSFSPTELVLIVDSSDAVLPGVATQLVTLGFTYTGGLSDGTTEPFTVVVSTQETPTDEECDLTNNQDTTTANVTAVVAETPTPDVQIGAEAGLDHVCVFEDTTSDPIAVTASTNAGSHLTTLVITGFPIGGAGFAYDFSGLDTDGAGTDVVVDTSQANTLGQVTITFGGSQTAYNGSFTVTPPADSDKDLGDLTATITSANNVDPSVTATDNDQAKVVVDAVADGDDVGDDGDLEVLNVTIDVMDGGDANGSFQAGEVGTVNITASFDDFHDGSEQHQLIITAAPGFVFLAPPPPIPGLTIIFLPNQITILVDSSDAVPPAGLGSVAFSVPVLFTGGPDGTSAPFTATVTTNEVPTDEECDPNNNSDSATASDTTVIAGTPRPTIDIAGDVDHVCVYEDTTSDPIPVNASTTAGSHLTSIVITGFPTIGGFTFDLSGLDTDGAGTGVTVDTTLLATLGQVTISFTGTQTSYSGSFTVTPAADSDLDLGTLTATVNAANDVDPSVTATTFDQADVIVDAVADGDDVGDDGDSDVFGVTISVVDSNGDANSTFQDGEVGTVTVTASYDDFTDGSEIHTLTVDAPAGFSFTLAGIPAILPPGVVLNVGLSTPIHLVFDVDSEGVDGVADLTLNIPVTYDGTQNDGTSGNFTATVTTTEDPTDEECTEGNNSDTASQTDTVVIAAAPEVRIGVGLLNGGECIFEDTEATFTVDAATTAGNHLTSIVLTGLPTGWSYDFSGLDTDGVGGDVVLDLTQLAAGQVTINFPNGNIVNYAGGTFTATPPADSDVDFGTLTGDVNAANDIDPTVTSTSSDSKFFETDAVADGDDVGDDGDADVFGVTISVVDSNGDANATFQDGEVGTVTVTASYDDFTDGSEIHTLTVDAPAGFSFTLAGIPAILPPGVTLNGLSTPIHLVFDVDSEGVDGVADLTLNIPVTYGGGQADGESGDFTATVTTTEDPTDEECTEGNNADTAIATAAAQILNDQATGTLDAEGCVFEDLQPNQFKGDATPQFEALIITFTPDDNEEPASATITIPDGWQLQVWDTSGGGSQVDLLAAGTDVDLSSYIDNILGFALPTYQLRPIPPEDSDVDAEFVLKLTIEDQDTGATKVLTETFTVFVDAVADLPTNVSITQSDSGLDEDGEAAGIADDLQFAKNETGSVLVTSNFADNDGSEVHKITINLGNGNFDFDDPSTAIIDYSNDGAGTFTYHYNGKDYQISFTYDNGVMELTLPAEIASFSHEFNIQNSDNKPFDSSKFELTTSVDENPATDGGCGDEDTDLDVEGQAGDNTAEVTVGPSAPNILNGTFITNTNVQKQVALVTFVDRQDPLRAFAQLVVRGGQGQQGAILTDAGFLIDALHEHLVSMEATAGTKVIVTDFDLEGVVIVDPGNAQLEVNDIQGGPDATGLVQLITPASEVGTLQEFESSEDDASDTAGTLTDDNAGNAGDADYVFGGAKDDTIDATSDGPNVLNGGDILNTANNGADTINGGAETDVLVFDYADTLNGNGGFDIVRVDYGAIYNTMKDEGLALPAGLSNATVDMRNANIFDVESILITEEATVSDSVGTKLIIEAQDVLDFTDNTTDADGLAPNTLYIIGSKGDSVELELDGVSIVGGVPTLIVDAVRGMSFNQYTLNNGGTLLVDTDVTVTTV